MRYPGRRKKSGGMVFPAVAALLIVTAAINFWFGSETAGAGEESSEAVTENTNPSGNGEETQTSQEDGQEPQDEPQAAVIRVALFGDDYGSLYQEEIRISSSEAYTLSWNGGERQMPGDSILTLTPSDECFAGGSARIRGTAGLQLLSSHRECGYPLYPGEMEVIPAEGKLAVVNEVSLEDYLCLVVPGEMPVSYGLEALKVQAICARSYAYQQMAEYGYPEYEAHVNDSTDYQVYGNSQAQEASSQAVNETQGQVARFNGQIVTTYYYSTSCGKTTSLEAWGTEPNEQNQYLQTVEVKDEEGDYERELPWYRWEARIQVQTLSNLVGLNTATDVGMLQNVEVTRTGPGGVALQICATGDKGSVTVDTENKIRRALGGSGYEIQKQDGNTVASSALLPSAFFTIGKEGDTFVIKGGGYGHGIGMSQNGANEMARKGKTYIDILTLFFPGITVE